MILNRIFTRRLPHISAYSFSRRFKPPRKNSWTDYINEQVKDVKESVQEELRLFKHLYQKTKNRFSGEKAEEEPFVS